MQPVPSVAYRANDRVAVFVFMIGVLCAMATRWSDIAAS